jgi:hypothetical protein
MPYMKYIVLATMSNANDAASFMIKMILNPMRKNFTRAQPVNIAN